MIYKNGTKLASIGAIGYKDYPTYMELEKKGKVPKGTASERTHGNGAGGNVGDGSGQN